MSSKKIPVVTMKSFKTQQTIDKHMKTFHKACAKYSHSSGAATAAPSSPRRIIPRGGVPLPFHASMLAGVKLRETEGPGARKKVPAGGKSLGISLDDIQSRLDAMKAGSRKTYVSRPAVITEAERRRLQTIREIEEKNRARAARAGIVEVVYVDGKGKRKSGRKSRKSKSGKKSRGSRKRKSGKSAKTKSRRRKLSKIASARRSARRAATIRAKKRASKLR